MRSDRDNQDKEYMISIGHDASLWPTSFIPYLTSSQHTETIRSSALQQQRYPIKEYRYSQYSWNRNFQHCYTEDEIQLLNKINTTYTHILDKEKHIGIFHLDVEKNWYDWWVCKKPSDVDFQQQLESESFTLPSHDAKDAKIYPLWSYADNKARQIANWQGERIRNQATTLMNDPVMLVYKELRDWYYNDLAERECKKDDLTYVDRRQSYIKNLIHLIPDFGPDRRHLNVLQQDLDKVNHLIMNCVANKELPELLSDIVKSGRNLEVTIGTYLHFLLIDERVSDNYSSDYLDGNAQKCEESPICKIYRAIDMKTSATSQDALMKVQEINPFYHMKIVPNAHGITQIDMHLDTKPLEKIRFASFVSSSDKLHYMEAVTTLDALIKVRRTLENFQTVQSKVGTYTFALNYLESANQLAENYLKLISKTRLLVKNLVSSANTGLNSILEKSNLRSVHKSFFEKNLRALETKVAKDTTVNAQLETYCSKAEESMKKYQDVMKKLVSDIHSGHASRDIETAMRDLMQQMNYLNSVLPAVLGKSSIIIDQSKIEDNIVAITPRADSETKNSHITPENLPAAQTATTQHTNTFDYAEWDNQVTRDQITHEPIFTLRAYRDNQEVGSISFYGQPILCRSGDKLQNNIVKTTGEFSDFIITDKMEINEVCQALPPSLFDRVLYSAHASAVNGIVRGGTHIIGYTLHSLGTPKGWSNLISQLCYFGYVFATRYTDYCSRTREYDHACDQVHALTYAAIETGKIWLTQCVLGGISALLERGGNALERHHWDGIGSGMKKIGSLFRYGIFAYSAVENGIAESAAAFAAGAAAEYVTEQAGRGIIKRLGA